MENHPIPQDVTGFQFKLIGDMTVKQFAYLAGGIIIGWVIFVLPTLFIIKAPIAFFFVLLGICLAFLPLSGRPMDIMLANFIKALFSPTQFIYQKSDTGILFPVLDYNIKIKEIKNKAKKTKQLPNQAKILKPKVFLQALPKTPKNKLDEKESNFFNSLFAKPSDATTAENPKSSFTPNLISINQSVTKSNREGPINPLEETEVLSKKADLIEKELETAKKEELSVQEKPAATDTNGQHQNVVALEKQLQEVLSEKEKLTRELMSLRQRLDTQKQDVYTPSTASVKRETKNVRRIPKSMGKTAGLPIAPDVPNLLVGIIKNPREQTLPNILVEVKDAEGNAVRAFKTNGIGQFASATPLANGTYTITFEDQTGQNKFDTVEFTADGSVITPIEIISVDTREELRRSLFNQTQ